MTDESFDCAATASLLDCGPVISNASNAAAVGAVIAAVSSGSVVLMVSLVMWPAVCWFAARAALDASLFRVMTANPEESGRMLDRYLSRATERTLKQRKAGTLRLLQSLIITFILQIASLIGGVLLIGWQRHA